MGCVCVWCAASVQPYSAGVCVGRRMGARAAHTPPGVLPLQCTHTATRPPPPTWILSMRPLTSPRPSSRPTKRRGSKDSNWSMCSPACGCGCARGRGAAGRAGAGDGEGVVVERMVVQDGGRQAGGCPATSPAQNAGVRRRSSARGQEPGGGAEGGLTRADEDDGTLGGRHCRQRAAALSVAVQLGQDAGTHLWQGNGGGGQARCEHAGGLARAGGPPHGAGRTAAQRPEWIPVPAA